MAKVYSFWIFDRHCNPIYHQDWSHIHAPSAPLPSSSAAAGAAAGPVSPSSSSSGLASIGATLQRASGAVTGSTPSTSAAAAAPPARLVDSSLPNVTRAPLPSRAPAASTAVHDHRSSSGSQFASHAGAPTGSSDALPFDEEAKLVYGVVFSLRNMVRKLGGSGESFNSYTTSTYTLAHLHTPTMYTFAILTDPVPPPSSIPSRSSDGYSIGSNANSSSISGGAAASSGAAAAGRSGFGTGGGIPGTGGMSLKGVLMQIYRGPWVEYVARNPLLTGLEREQREVEATLDEDSDDDEGDELGATQAAVKLKLVSEAKVGRSEGVDSDAFRDGIERVLAQNKLSAPSSSLAT
ncbi:Trafficking protein particle complex subunit BET5 [Thecaphora frezii]